MDINGIAGMATAMAESSTNQAVGIAVLKKAMDVNAAGALALIEALPDANQSAANLPPHLGQNINLTA
ncbi:MAG: YjfB family protein [Gammaproteobacteria bacterium]|nr:MAG: YjfB family protein [Gammaproteobacteria bacterium]